MARLPGFVCHNRAGAGKDPLKAFRRRRKADRGVNRERRQRVRPEKSNSKVSYKVDDDNKVKDYVGKQVKITGTLDPSANVIHVDSIELVS